VSVGLSVILPREVGPRELHDLDCCKFSSRRLRGTRDCAIWNDSFQFKMLHTYRAKDSVRVGLSVILPREVGPFVLNGEKIKLLDKIEKISKNQKSFLFLQLLNMVIIAKKILREFVLTHPDSDRGIEKWYTLTKAADW